MVLNFDVSVKDIKEERKQQRAKEWGWLNPPEDILEIAGLSLRLQTMNREDAVVYLGLLDKETCQAILPKKPASKPVFQFLGQSAGLGTDSFELQQVPALYYGYPVCKTLANLVPHPELNKDKDLYHACDRMDAVLMLIDNHKPILFFHSYKKLDEFKSRGKRSKYNDPILNALKRVRNKSRRETDLQLGIASAQEISLIMQKNLPTGEFIKEGTDQTNDNIWHYYDTQEDPALKKLARLIDYAVADEVTDLAIDPEYDGTAIVMFRQYGDMTRPTYQESKSKKKKPFFLNHVEYESIVNFLMRQSRAHESGTRLKKPADGAFLYTSPTTSSQRTEVHIRASFIPIDLGLTAFQTISVSLRVLPRKKGEQISLQSLNIDPEIIHAIKNILDKTQGKIILAGPTSSGKSTTIAGMITEHVKIFGTTKKRISMEDPVERFLPDILQISIPQNEKSAFSDIMKACLRHDPDLFWVGEIRDPLTAETSVQAANSGHMVLTTVHASDAIMAWRRLHMLVDGIKQFDLVESFSMIIGQRLLKRVCSCATGHRALTKEEQNRFETYQGYHNHSYDLPAKVIVPNKNGCGKCTDGFDGRVPVLEVLPVTRKVKNLMLKEDFNYEEIAECRMNTLFGSALKLLKQNKVEFGSIFI
ncbi:MAG: Flp pilus assembly complex ATPase component [Desulfobacteraceae bacterium]|nr:Flp pilus assembly complex ATPase component [Desulfobacteraceae bacterium]